MDFVIAHPRSGTNYVSQLLQLAGPHIAAHEHLVQKKLNKILVEKATAFYEQRCSIDEIQAILQYYHFEPTVRIDVNWKLTWILEPLLQRFPEARFVHVVRDPRECVRSCYNLGFYRNVAPQIEAIFWQLRDVFPHATPLAIASEIFNELYWNAHYLPKDQHSWVGRYVGFRAELCLLDGDTKVDSQCSVRTPELPAGASGRDSDS